MIIILYFQDTSSGQTPSRRQQIASTSTTGGPHSYSVENVSGTGLTGSLASATATGSPVVIGLAVGFGFCLVILLGVGVFAYLLYRVPG